MSVPSIPSSAPSSASSANPSPAASAPAAPSPAPKRKIHWLLYVLGAFLALGLVIVGTVAFTIWWIQRPITPVVLTAPEKAAVEAKLQQMGGGTATTPASDQLDAGRGTATPQAPERRDAGRGERTAKSPVPARSPVADEVPMVKLDRPYEPGSKVLTLTEREINGLLNANTDLGQNVRLEFGRDAINAYLAVPIPQDFPIGGGKMFRARGRFKVSLGNGQVPVAILEDVTIFGLSLPKAWLGGLKGENLLSEAMGKRDGGPVLQGIKSLRVEPGALVLEVED